jgi:nucleoside-diphosphate-sugar epimerase
MRVLVSGSAAHLAQPFLPRLCAQQNVSQVIGIDIKPSKFTHHKYQHHILDIRSPDIDQHLKNVDAVYHLAFVVLRSSLKKQRMDRELIRDINVNGSRNLFHAAQQAGVKRLIHLSSAVVYGAWADNPETMDEQQVMRPMPGFSYAEDKVAVEKILDEMEQDAACPQIIRLRPHVILGPHSQPFLLNLLRQPFYPRLPEPQPLSQCVWEDDVISAMLLCLETTEHGAFNLAAQPPMSFKAMIQLNRRISCPLPYSLIKKAHQCLWKISSVGEEPAWFDGVQHSLAIDSTRAQQRLGWQAEKSSQQCIEAVRRN